MATGERSSISRENGHERRERKSDRDNYPAEEKGQVVMSERE